MKTVYVVSDNIDCACDEFIRHDKVEDAAKELAELNRCHVLNHKIFKITVEEIS